MKSVLFSALTNYFVRNKDFTPVANNGDELVFNTGLNSMIKDAFGTIYQVDFVDVDCFSCEELKQLLEINKNRLLEMEGSHSHYIFKVFFFDSRSDKEKIKTIEDAQIHKIKSKRFLKCITVDLELKDVSKHFKVPLVDGISKTLKAFLHENKEFDASTSEEISEILLSKQKDYEIEFKAKIPVLTYVLIAINVLIWAVMNLYSLKSGTDINQLLIDYGAKENTLILSGEYWRFLTPVFLHAGIVHLLLNCYTLYALGIGVEKIFGRWRFLAIYFIAGLIGNIASFMFSTSWGVGASGAIFGLMGAMLYYGFEKPALFKNYFGPSIITTILINVMYGLSRSGIDNFAHIGGLIGGFFATGMVFSLKEPKKWYLNTKIMFLVIIGITIGGLFYGFNNDESKINEKVTQLEQLDKEQKWDDAEKLAEEIMGLKPSNEYTKLKVLWPLVKAEAVKKKFDKAVENAKTIKAISPADGCFILGVVYLDMGKYDDAKKELLEAKSLKAEHNNIDELLNQIEAAKGYNYKMHPLSRTK